MGGCVQRLGVMAQRGDVLHDCKESAEKYLTKIPARNTMEPVEEKGCS